MMRNILQRQVGPSTPWRKSRDPLRVGPEWHFFTSPLTAGMSTTEWVKFFLAFQGEL